MKRFVLTPLAEQDLNEIWEYIGDESVEAANRILGKIETAIYRLAEHPGLGHLREDLGGSVDEQPRTTRRVAPGAHQR
jgi:plasmid stabilization system protein ParE